MTAARFAALAAAGLFLLLGACIVAGLTAPFDRAVLAHLRLAGRPGVADFPAWAVAAAIALTQAGPVFVRGPLLLVGALWLRARGEGRQAAALVAAVLGEELLVQLIKACVARPRPDRAWALVHAGSTSFPSGHAAGCMVLYPLLGLFLGALHGRRWARVGAAAGVALALLVGITRVLLGVHWTADVVAGWLLGTAIAAFAAGALSPGGAGRLGR